MTDDDFDLFAPKQGDLDLALEDVPKKAPPKPSDELPALDGPGAPVVPSGSAPRPAAAKSTAGPPDEVDRAARFGPPGDGWADHARYALRVWSRLRVNEERIVLAERRRAAATNAADAHSVKLEIERLRLVPERVDAAARKRGLTVLAAASVAFFVVTFAVALFG